MRKYEIRYYNDFNAQYYTTEVIGNVDLVKTITLLVNNGYDIVDVTTIGRG